MTVLDFFSLVVRLFGLWVLYMCIYSAETLLAMKFMPSYGDTRSLLLLRLFDFLLHVGIGLTLTFRPEIVTNRLPLRTAKEGARGQVLFFARTTSAEVKCKKQDLTP
jgi:hypothetical protein